MRLFNRFPFTNFNNINLDWFIEIIKELAADVKTLSDKVDAIDPDNISERLAGIESELSETHDLAGIANISAGEAKTQINTLSESVAALPSDATPAWFSRDPSSGTSTKLSRADHVHKGVKSAAFTVAGRYITVNFPGNYRRVFIVMLGGYSNKGTCGMITTTGTGRPYYLRLDGDTSNTKITFNNAESGVIFDTGVANQGMHLLCFYSQTDSGADPVLVGSDVEPTTTTSSITQINETTAQINESVSVQPYDPIADTM